METERPLNARVRHAMPRYAQNLALAAILLLATFLNCFRLWQVGFNGLGNAYYAAGVQSMLTGWRNFFFLTFDPAGFLSLDKAPLALWIQAASARIFGFHGLSLLLPQALAGVASVYVLYRLVRRVYGAPAGMLAALALAVTPISVVTNRTNFPDAWLILVLLLATSAVSRSVEKGSLRWLLVGAALVGVAFNIKMLQILLVVPALASLVLFAAPLSWRKRLLYGGLAVLVAVAVSLPWVLAVEWTPAEQRPYVGGSTTNSVLELALVYNGIQRLWGEDFSFFLGRPSPLRLFNNKLAGQIGWMLPLAVAGLLVAAWRLRHDEPPDSRALRRSALVLWSGWLIPQLLYFSVSLFYHRYYLATLAPAVAALVGIGVQTLWSAWQAGGRVRWSVVGALALSATVQAVILLPYPSWSVWLIPLILGLCAIAVAVLFLVWRNPALTARRWAAAALAGGSLALLIAPAVWAAIPVVTCTNMTLPYAGPQEKACQSFEIRPFLDPGLVAYLEAHRQGARYLAATYDLGIAELGILETGEPFMALGGYRGCDPILTVDQFAQLVADGEVRFFLSLEEGGERWPQQESVWQWVEARCPLSTFESPGVQVWGPCAAQ